MKYIILAFIVFSCNSKEDKPKIYSENDSVVKLNNKAMELHSKNSGNKDSTLKAIAILTEIIKIDSNYNLAYWNKLGLLLKLKKRNEALDLIPKVKIENPIQASIFEGNIYENMQKLELANQSYKKAEDLLNLKIIKYPKNVKLKIELATLHLNTKNKNDAVNEIIGIAKDNPNEKFMNDYVDYFRNFDKKEYLKVY